MRRLKIAVLMGTAVSLSAAFSAGHVSISSGPGFADTTQEVTFSVGHGCEGFDTSGVRLTIPAGVTSVRAVPNDFGKATVEKDAAGLVTAVSWQKAPADVLPGDTAYYKLVVRFRVPNQPFTTVHFPARQTCIGADGGLMNVDWTATMPLPDGGGPEPAPALNIVPARRPGWNKYTVPAAISDLSIFFGDALIVWKGSAAYSANPNTASLIGMTAGVTSLTALAANDEIWVKY